MSDAQAGRLTPLQQSWAVIQRLEENLESLRRSRTEPIAVVGMGCRFPGGVDSPQALQGFLEEGRDAQGPIPTERWHAEHIKGDSSSGTRGYFLDDVASFDPAVFGIAPREVESMDPQQRLLMEVTFQALEHGGLAPDTLAGSHTGVFIGIGTNDYSLRLLDIKGRERIDGWFGTGNGPCYAAGRIAHSLGLEGPCMALDTACSSSLVAIHQACNALRNGECDMALAGGVQLMLSPEVMIFLERSGALAPDGRCKTFDASGNGYGRGEGCGMVVLQRLSDAKREGRRILAQILGSAVNHDGKASGLTVPNGSAQKRVMKAALKTAGVAPHRVEYVEAHGTGTALGDPVEIHALQAVYGERPADKPLRVGSVKNHLGHLEAAAGIAGFIRVVCHLQEGRIAPQRDFSVPNPKIEWTRAPIEVVTEPTTWEEKNTPLAGISSFGMSGSNAHMIVQGVAAQESTRPKQDVYPLVLSAMDAESLRRLAQAHANHLENHDDIHLEDLSHTLNRGRATMPQRLYTSASTVTEAGSRFHAFARGEVQNGLYHGSFETSPQPIFIFPEVLVDFDAAQLEHYGNIPAFRAALKTCQTILEGMDVDLQDLLRSIATSEEKHPLNPLAAACWSYAHAEMWAAEGIAPAAVLGHGMGEYTAASCAGVMTIAQCLEIIKVLLEYAAGLPDEGAMASVDMHWQSLLKYLNRHDERVGIAAYNSHSNAVISGPSQAVAEVVAALRAEGMECRETPHGHGLRSPMMASILPDVEKSLRTIAWAQPRVPIISGSLGERLKNSITSPLYWLDQFKEPVQFMNAVEKLEAWPQAIVLEMSCVTDLIRHIRETRFADDLIIPPDWNIKQSPLLNQLDHMGFAYVQGLLKKWPETTDRGRIIDIPTYTFNKDRFWVGYPETEAAGRRPGCYEESWHPLTSDPSAELERGGHWLVFAPGDHGTPEVFSALGRMGATVTVIPLGETHEGINWEAIESQLVSLDTPRGVIFAWGLATRYPPATFDAEISVHNHVIYNALIKLSQYLSRDWKDTKLWVLTRGAVALPDVKDPTQAVLWGMGKALAMDLPEHFAALIDLDPDDETFELETLLMGGAGHEDLMAIRKGQVQVKRLEHLELKEAAALKSDGTYLITGGLGSIGLQVARFLAEKGAGHLVLASRSGGDGLDDDSRELLREIERSTRLTLLSLDVTDGDAVNAVLSDLRQDAMPLRGIFHGAGVAGFHSLEEVTPDLFDRVTRAKILGAENLHRASCVDNLDLFVCFSSIASVWGSRGQVHYAAGNRYLDGLMSLRQSQGLSGLSVNWGPWPTGMADEKALQELAAIGIDTVEPEAYLSAMMQLIGTGTSHGVLVDLDVPRFNKVFTARGQRLLFHALDSSQNAQEIELKPLRELPQDRAAILQHCRDIAGEVLGFPASRKPSTVRGFFEMGMDSLTAIELHERISLELGLKLPKTLAFDYPNLEELATHLFSRLSQTAASAKPTEASDATEGRSLNGIESQLAEMKKHLMKLGASIDSPILNKGILRS